MLCPWCDRDMEKGFLMSGKPIVFGPEKRNVAIWPPKSGEVRLAKGGWNMASVPAWKCAGCKRVVVEYGTEG